MSLPAPNLDDRKFQDLVDEAKRYVQASCPEWSDHNVSDPGVTLIETFAHMVEQLIYRLNRVPDRNFVKFLELLGVRLFPPTAARADVTFWLAAPLGEVVTVPTGTEVATVRTETQDAIAFTTLDDLPIIPCERDRVQTSVEEGKVVDQTELLDRQDGFFCFDRQPKPGDTFLIGLSNAVPSCAITLRFDCQIEGVGVDPRYPPLVWEAWTPDGWTECDLERDETGGLNRAGDVVIHVPRLHDVSVENRLRAGWVRARVVEPDEGQPFYSASPKILRVTAFTVGGTTAAANAEVVDNEVIGLSEGVPGQTFPLTSRPVVEAGDQPVILEVAGGDGWEEWTQVTSFAASGPTDHHFVLDSVTGEVQLGPAVVEADGTVRQYGAVPPPAAPLRVRAYRTGGGEGGNVAKGVIQVLKTSIPFISTVENRRMATGGQDGEALDNAKKRGPILLRTRDRAVTTEDYEQLAVEAAPEIARVRAVAAGDAGPDAGGVRVLVVPQLTPDELMRIEFGDLLPNDDVLTRIADYLDARRLIGHRVVVESPSYASIGVVAAVRARPRFRPDTLEQDALRALYGYFSPITGGPGGTGWDFGRPVHAGEVYAVLQELPGVEFVEESRLFQFDPITQRPASQDDVPSLTLGPHDLVHSFRHQIRVTTA